MDNKLKQGILIAFISFTAGGLVTFFVTDYIKLKSNSHSLKNKNLSKRVKAKKQDPFSQIEKMHDRMRKRINNTFGSPFGSTMFDVDPFFVDSMNDIKVEHYEDDSFKYIEVSGDGVSKDSLQVEISNGMVSIKGEIKKSEKNNNSNSHSRSSHISRFNQSFNVPFGVDEASVKIESENNKLIIKFPKE